MTITRVRASNVATKGLVSKHRDILATLLAAGGPSFLIFRLPRSVGGGHWGGGGVLQIPFVLLQQMEGKERGKWGGGGGSTRPTVVLWSGLNE